MAGSFAGWVDPFFGVDKGGNTLCGPYMPLGLARPGPDTWPPVPTNTSGYSSDGRILRFSQNHASGTGGAARYGNIAVTPFVGEPTPHLSAYDKADETAEVGRYAVRLMPQDIGVEITATERCGVYRFRFPACAKANVLIDAGSVIRLGDVTSNHEVSPQSVGGYVEVSGEREVIGRGDLRGGWGHWFPYSVHFCARFDRPFTRAHTALGPVMTKRSVSVGPDSKAILTFDNAEELNLTISISYKSIANARESLAREASGRSFDDIRQANVHAWEERLSAIELEGGSEPDRRLLYTSIYRLFCMPSDLGIDDEFHLWRSGVRHFTDYYALWDSVRNANSLIGLLEPELEVDMLNCLLDVAERTGWIPDAWIAGHSAQVQGGSSADVLVCEAAIKGLEGINFEKALVQMRRNNEVISPDPVLYGRYLEDYRDLGYVSDRAINCVSRHIEYSYQDWCIGRLAERLGKMDVARDYYASSRKLWNLWNPELKCFAPKTPEGEWSKPFDPRRPQRRDYWYDPHFYEGIAYEWSLCGLQDIAGLVERHGGPEAFVRHLDDFFDNLLYHMKEMILHTPFLYHYAGRPDKSADRARQLLGRYCPTRDGLYDNEDMGSHSAYIVCTMLGIYPVMGQDIYLLTPPVFDTSRILLGQTGKALTVRRRGGPEGAGYIVRATVDGRPHERNWITHGELLGAEIIDFDIAETPGEWGRTPPPSPLQSA